MQTHIDHLVIGAADLARGTAYVRDMLGVEIPYGGFHPAMGTHNHLMQLGGETFLEVIAANPNGDPPPGPRWYGLDDPYVRHRIEAEPCLLTWVVRTADIDDTMQRATLSLGRAEPITRGDLTWRFGLPDDGRLLAGGLLPYVIDWGDTPHPSAGMADTGCRLAGLAIHHPRAEWIRSILASFDAAGLADVHELPGDARPFLAARIETPTGSRTLYSAV